MTGVITATPRLSAEGNLRVISADARVTHPAVLAGGTVFGGLFLGSGVVGAGCNPVIGRRLKRSGGHWTIAAAHPLPDDVRHVLEAISPRTLIR